MLDVQRWVHVGLRLDLGVRYTYGRGLISQNMRPRLRCKLSRALELLDHQCQCNRPSTRHMLKAKTTMNRLNF